MRPFIRYTRPLYTLLLISLLALTLVRCGASDSTNKPADLPPATVRWGTWDSSSPAEKLLVKQFHEQYSQIEFKREQPDSATFNLVKESPPFDLLNTDVDQSLDQMIRQGDLAELSELWQETGLHEQVPASLQKLSERDGKQYYIPFGFGWVGFYYNKAIFAQYNLQPPKTWEEFLQICATLKNNGEIPLSIDGSEPWNNYEWFEYLNLRLNGPEFHRGLTSGKERFDDERVRRTLETWKSLFDNDYYIKEPQFVTGMNTVLTLVRAERAKSLTREKAVMVLSDAYTVSQIPPIFLNELGFFRFPIIDSTFPKAEIVDAFGYVIPTNADHASQAMAFLTYLTEPKSQIVVAQQGLFSSVTYAPARMDVERSGLRFDQQGAMEMLQEADVAVPYLWLALPREVWGMMSYSFNRFIKDRDVDVFIGKMEEARQAGLKKGLFAVE